MRCELTGNATTRFGGPSVRRPFRYLPERNPFLKAVSDSGGHRFILLLRNTQTGEFAISTELTGPPGQKLFGRNARYVPMTDELYFVSTRTRQISRSPDGRIADGWDLFRLTHASIVFGSDTSQHLLP